MTKTLLIMSLALACIFFTGCGDSAPGPEETVRFFLENSTKGDFNQLSAVVVRNDHSTLQQILDDLNYRIQNECGEIIITVHSTKTIQQTEDEAVVVFDGTLHCPKTGEDDRTQEEIRLIKEDGIWKIFFF